jgi:L-seryl-tRNA(Ser) seleniumtransferase
MPVETVPSAGLAIRPADPRASGRAVLDLAAAFRALPIPVIGRIADGALVLDLRCLEDADGFRANLAGLAP